MPRGESMNLEQLQNTHIYNNQYLTTQGLGAKALGVSYRCLKCKIIIYVYKGISGRVLAYTPPETINPPCHQNILNRINTVWTLFKSSTIVLAVGIIK